MFKLQLCLNKKPHQYGDFYTVVHAQSGSTICILEQAVSNCCAVVSLSKLNLNHPAILEFLNALQNKAFSVVRMFEPSQIIFFLPTHEQSTDWVKHEDVYPQWTFRSHESRYDLTMYNIPFKND